MDFFKGNYLHFNWPIAESGQNGFRLPQAAALHAIASHCMQKREAAIVTMPTGSGKTAVLFGSAFLLRAKRVLVITPSRLVREQIVEGFKTLGLLRTLGAVTADTANPVVVNVRERVKTLAMWQAFEAADVVVGIPSSLSPEIEGIPDPPPGLFDVVLVDEAHHSPAATWAALLKHFHESSRVLFTATPFRQDRKPLVGSFVYTYEMKSAYADGVFGQIHFEPAVPEGTESADIAIARATEHTFRTDQSAGLNHVVMVRTGQVSRALQLKELYDQNTSLRLEVVSGDKSLRFVKTVLSKISAGELDGLVCVDMLGEGFDFPNLKIAALHTPHRSLAVTLQFIGRFARTTGDRLGPATFHAVESELEVERTKLFEEGAVWQDLLQGLSTDRVQQEQTTQVVLRTFIQSLQPPSDFPDLSLLSLRPYFHVKILKATEALAFDQALQFPGSTVTVYQHVSQEHNTGVYITQRIIRPKWTSASHLAAVEHHLVIIHQHASTGYTFICSSERDDELYDKLACQLSPNGVTRLRGVPIDRLNRILDGLQNYRFFNIGKRSTSGANRNASYITLVGPAPTKRSHKLTAGTFIEGTGTAPR